MTDHDVRVLDDAEHRAARDLFHRTLHSPPATDEDWERRRPSYGRGRTLGAFADGTMVGTTWSFDSELTVPGGAVLPMAAVSGVGVRADHTRRGVLTALMRTQLTGFGEPVATLRASEGVIYERFGYGVASRGRSVRLQRGKAVLRPGVPSGGTVRLLDDDEVWQVLPAVYRRCTGRPGAIGRSPQWWEIINGHVLGSPQTSRGFAVHRGTDGDDGFAAYQVKAEPGEHYQWVMQVDDLHASTPEALAGLWRFLLSVDLITKIDGWLRPVDEPLEWMLTDPRDCATTHIEDETWLRLVDVPSALAAREYGEAEPVVLGLTDPLLPGNSGCYRIGPHGAERVDADAQLELDVSALGALYLGDVRPSTLVAAGRLRVLDAAALPRADRLLATDRVPWSGTYF